VYLAAAAAEKMFGLAELAG